MEVTADGVQRHPRFPEFQNSASGTRWAFTMGELTPTQCEELCEDWLMWLLEAPEQHPVPDAGDVGSAAKGVSSSAEPADKGTIRCYVLDNDGTKVKELPIPASEDESLALCLWDKPTSNADLVLSHISASKVQLLLFSAFGGPMEGTRMKKPDSAIQFVTVKDHNKIVLALSCELLGVDKLGQDITFNRIVRDGAGRVFYAKVCSVHCDHVSVCDHQNAPRCDCHFVSLRLCSSASSCFSTQGLRTKWRKT
jgi:hypothetical protein